MMTYQVDKEVTRVEMWVRIHNDDRSIDKKVAKLERPWDSHI